MGFEFFEEREFKETELGPLPVDWQVVRLGEVVDTIKGKKPKTLTEVYSSGYIPYLTTLYLRAKVPDKFCNPEDESAVLVDSYEVILIWDGSNAGEVFIGMSGVLASTMVKIIPKEEAEIENKFLYYYLKTKFDLLNVQTVGSTIPHVSKNLFYNLPIPLPPLEEQKAIAEVLRRVQVAIEKTEEVIRATKGLKKSMMKHLFTYGNVPIDKVDRVKLKETEIGLIPEHWQVVRLGEVVEEATNGDWGNDKFTDGFSQCHVIRGTDFTKMDRGLYNEVPKRYIKTSKLRRLALKPNDLLIELSGGGPDQPTGRIFIVRDHIIERLNPVCFSNFVKRIRVNMELTHPEFFYRYWQYLYIQGRTRLYERRTTGIRNFKFIDFINSENISLPPLKEQKEIARILQAVDEKIQKEQERKKALENLFKSLLHNLMSGKIRIKMGE